MAAPTIVSVYPADEDTGIPTGAVLSVVFSRGVDLDTVQKSIVLYGADSDTASGPDSAQWLNQESGENPFYLRSPGFKGVVDCDYELVYIDSDDEPVDPQPTILDSGDETAGPYRMRVDITPKRPLAPSVQYTLHVIGDTDDTGRGVGSRTVFDVDDAAVVSTTAFALVTGVCTRPAAETVRVEVTTPGAIGTAKYRWYYVSEGVGTAVEGKVTSRRYRRLADGLQIRFDGSGFLASDLWAFAVEPQELLQTSTTVVFVTGDGSYTAAPASPSTPATSSPPASAIPGSSVSEDLYVVEMDPPDAGSNIAFNDGTITLTFSGLLDEDTVTDATVTVWAYPVSGVYSDTNQPVELSKRLTVSGATLTIEV